MPELPEVETVRRDLEVETLHKRIESVCVSGHRTVRRQPPAELTRRVEGRTVTALRRLGKFVFADLEDDQTLVLHLRMSGQLLWTPDPDNTALVKHTHVRMRFASGEELRFVDPRTFGEWWVTTPDVPELSHMGPDALLGLPTPATLAQRLGQRRSSLKTVLLNQTVIAGIGNIYGDEILFRAKLRPRRLPATLTKPAMARLHEAIGTVLREAVDQRGSTLSDQQYVDLYGRVGEAQRTHLVHARGGEPCLVCGTAIVRIVIGGRSAYYCPHCQK